MRVRCGENTSWLTPSENVINRESTRFTKRRRFARGCRARSPRGLTPRASWKSSTCTAPVFVPTASIRLSIARHAEKPLPAPSISVADRARDLTEAFGLPRRLDDSDDSDSPRWDARSASSTSLQYAMTPSPGATVASASARVFTSVTGAPWSAMVPRHAPSRRPTRERFGRGLIGSLSRSSHETKRRTARRARAPGASPLSRRPRRATRPRRRPRRTSPAEASDETRGVGPRRKEPFFAGAGPGRDGEDRARRAAERRLARERSRGYTVAASSVLLLFQTQSLDADSRQRLTAKDAPRLRAQGARAVTANKDASASLKRRDESGRATDPACPRSVASGAPVATHHTFTSPSVEAEATKGFFFLFSFFPVAFFPVEHAYI